MQVTPTSHSLPLVQEHYVSRRRRRSKRGICPLPASFRFSMRVVPATSAQWNVSSSESTLSRAIFSALQRCTTSQIARYHPGSGKWLESVPNIRMEAAPFAQGAMRAAHRMLDMSAGEQERNYVAKLARRQIPRSQ